MPRIEHDSLGELEVPDHAYYGIHTQRAITNFPISGEPLPRAFIHAHVLLKKAAATVNRDLNLLPANFAAAIIQAADEILANAPWSLDQFPIDIYQTGSGTSTNMNVNEVLATRANQILATLTPDGNPGVWAPNADLSSFPHPIHPNDHVNMCQSSNDTIPTSMQVMAKVLIGTNLRGGVSRLYQSLWNKSKELWPIIKTGRTHLQDATPIRLGQEFRGHSQQLKQALDQCGDAMGRLSELPIGGTAVGTGINSHPEFAARVCLELIRFTEGGGAALKTKAFIETDKHFCAQSTLDTAVFVHGALKNIAVSLTKIANDIRWMASGPRAGLGEINLPAVQPGSSIMPGKVNPVIAESLLMVCQRVIGNDATLTAAATGCNFELAMSLPLAVKLLHESITLLASACTNFAKNCIDGITATDRSPALVESGLMLATALAPILGYEAAAAIAKEAAASGRTIREVAREKTNLTDDQLNNLLDPTKMVGN